jgi:ketosteroid isomerase-like protein
MTSGQASRDPSSIGSVVERYVVAMQRGPEGHAALVDLFTEDGVYVEPFGGHGPHVGRAAIRAYLAAAAGQAPPQVRLVVERLDLSPGRAVVEWRCESPAFAVPSRGRDVFDVRDGRIARLQTELTQPPVLQGE